LRVGIQALSAKGYYWTVANVLGLISVFLKSQKGPSCLGAWGKTNMIWILGIFY